MNCIPRGFGVGPRGAFITMLTKSEANFHFIVPSWFVPIDEIAFGGILPCTLDDKISALEI